MKKLASLVIPALAGTLFVGCETNDGSNRNRTVFRLEENPRGGGGDGSRYGYQANQKKPEGSGTQYVTGHGPDEGEPDDVLGGGSGDTAPAGPGTTDPGGTTDAGTGGTPTGPTGTDPTPPAPAANAPFASPVPGKFGHVYSPFASGKEVDVSGYPPGTEVRCPYTQKIFKVP